ncbi:MAG: DUF4097 family beta strand repeat protein [candidate division WOR-3 bacterium]|nr:MAG: DUF4097 family beta strand repeat protein [candidate division WOR-3 bacterium]
MKVTTYVFPILLTFSLGSQNNHTEQITIPLSNRNEPGHLTINHHKGSIHVAGYHGTSVIVKATMRLGTGEESINLGAVEGNNHVVINATPRHRTIDLDIKVPYRFSLRLKNDDSGNITAENLSGELEISNINGDISLQDISGAAMLDTIDGDITVQFRDIARGVPMAFSSVEGNINITFPRDVNVLTKARADSGYILNDFTQTKKQEVAGSTWSYGKLNDSGPEMLMRSFLGNIHIRCEQGE